MLFHLVILLHATNILANTSSSPISCTQIKAIYQQASLIDGETGCCSNPNGTLDTEDCDSTISSVVNDELERMLSANSYDQFRSATLKTKLPDMTNETVILVHGAGPPVFYASLNAQLSEWGVSVVLPAREGEAYHLGIDRGGVVCYLCCGEDATLSHEVDCSGE